MIGRRELRTSGFHVGIRLPVVIASSKVVPTPLIVRSEGLRLVVSTSRKFRALASFLQLRYFLFLLVCRKQKSSGKFLLRRCIIPRFAQIDAFGAQQCPLNVSPVVIEAILDRRITSESLAFNNKPKRQILVIQDVEIRNGELFEGGCPRVVPP